MNTRNIAISLLLLNSLLLGGTPEQELKDIEQQATHLIVEKTEHMCALCTEIAKIYIELGGDSQNDDLQALLTMKSNPVTYDTLLNVIYTCLSMEWPKAQAAQETKEQLSLLHEELTEEYDSMLAQLAVRKRLKSKCFCTLSAANLVACRARIKGNITIDGSATIGNNLRVGNTLTVDDLTGVVMATDGLFSTGLVQNADLADNSVTSDKIVDGAIIPSKLIFNTVDTAGSEPDLLRIYRGTINSDGTTANGAGFTSVRNGLGNYTITITGGAYTSNATYQVFVQTAPNAATVTKDNSTQFTIDTTADQAFDFFTIGSRP